jgi:hypothetical protein
MENTGQPTVHLSFSAKRKIHVRDAILLLANAIGAMFYVIRASPAWRISQEGAAGLDSITGEPFVWAINVFPIWIIFAVLNTSWAAVLLTRREWRSARIWVLTLIFWLTAATIDFAHH